MSCPLQTIIRFFRKRKRVSNSKNKHDREDRHDRKDKISRRGGEEGDVWDDRKGRLEEDRKDRNLAKNIANNPLKPKIPSSLEAILGELHPVNSDTVDIEIGLRDKGS